MDLVPRTAVSYVPKDRESGATPDPKPSPVQSHLTPDPQITPRSTPRPRVSNDRDLDGGRDKGPGLFRVNQRPLRCHRLDLPDLGL